jgi:hypothetical protein
MTTLPTPYAPSYTTDPADDDTLRMPLPTTHRTVDPHADRYIQPGADHTVDQHVNQYADHYAQPDADPTADRDTGRRPAGPALDATRLWTGGLATAAVAALVGLVGTLVIRVLFEYAPVGTAATHAFTTSNAGLMCLFAAVAALAATGVAHLLIVSTPDPLSYLGWIIGLSTAAAVVLPLLGGIPMAAAISIAVVNLVIGLAIGSLVIGTAMSARRPAAR